MADLAEFQHLAIAAAIGFLIGFQREWRDREEAKEGAFAGARTFALVGFAGGAAGLFDESLVLVAVGLAGVSALTVAAYWEQARRAPGLGGTTEVAFIATYILGALATRGEPALAAAGAVGVAILLALKPSVQRWAKAIDAREIGAALRFLALSVIVLPILPNESFGPYGALNPRQIWQLVVLISGLSFAGYWLTKLFGERGVVLTGLVGGLASSTATTLSLSRFIGAGAASLSAGAAGIVAANVVMLIRVAVLIAAVSLRVLEAIWPALAAGVVAGVVAAMLLWRGEKAAGAQMQLGNPMELKPALFFAALLAVIAVLSRFASDRFGDSGLYAVALVTGVADVDALTLSAAGQSGAGEIPAATAGVAILMAVASNIIVKAGMTAVIAGVGAGLRVALAFAAILAAGAVALFYSAAF